MVAKVLNPIAVSLDAFWRIEGEISHLVPQAFHDSCMDGMCVSEVGLLNDIPSFAVLLFCQQITDSSKWLRSKAAVEEAVTHLQSIAVFSKLKSGLCLNMYNLIRAVLASMRAALRVLTNLAA